MKPKKPHKSGKLKYASRPVSGISDEEYRGIQELVAGMPEPLNTFAGLARYAIRQTVIEIKREREEERELQSKLKKAGLSD